MCRYKAFYDHKVMEVIAESSYQAQQKAIAFFNPPKRSRHMVTVVFLEVIRHEVAEASHCG